MEFITSLSRKELQELITESVQKVLTDKLSPPVPEQLDRCGIDDACIELGVPGRPVSKAYVYKLTHAKKIPHQLNGRFLEFSRRQLKAYREANTLNPSALEEEQEAKRIKAASKKLGNE
jgi:hypothetical protein